MNSVYYRLNDLLILKDRLSNFISQKSRLFLNSKKYKFANYAELKELLNKSLSYQRLVDDIIFLNYSNNNINPINYILLTTNNDLDIIGYIEQLTINY